MTVLIDIESQEHHLFSRAPSAAYTKVAGERREECLDIGLINNMSDAALISTERQVFDLLNAAAGRLCVRLHFYAIESTPRSEWGRDYVHRYYRGVGDLLSRRMDGVIVTGAEPKASRLAEEPYWPSFVEIADWATENTASSVFSCLAVHGAVLHMDGVPRHKLGTKCFGVFAQTKTRRHPLMQDVPRTFRIPHARWNEVQEEDLSNCGYSVLSWSRESGVDCFIKPQKKSLFVYFQGHPEYETLSLLGEYRRDMGRFLRGENEVCPTIPRSYLNEGAEELLIAFRQEALSHRRSELFADFPLDRLANNLSNVWRLPAQRIYRNWLLYLVSQQARRSNASGAREESLSAVGLATRRHQRRLVAARSAHLARAQAR
ncbi:homoserine O-succinyltransferase [Bradyrhizobium sp. CCBAU 53340]|uniref:homoserine O-succinyltransferase MetA n=1 Tax=Bradyrhizobium sp. CCBAU 53340 TaxID=1325112 RepID=UPI00188C8FB0|nr:homoserine O-succinyltransferase [Bradyrhizobium sp. CCBAU 53340]QOZ46231.1 homoserine O-succinyltransferase [Bradyrhizobium sp. CCBAU 53340]